MTRRLFLPRPLPGLILTLYGTHSNSEIIIQIQIFSFRKIEIENVVGGFCSGAGVLGTDPLYTR